MQTITARRYSLGCDSFDTRALLVVISGPVTAHIFYAGILKKDMLPLILRHYWLAFQHKKARLRPARVAINSLHARPSLPWPAWSPDLFYRTHFGRYVKPIATILEFCRFSLTVWDPKLFKALQSKFISLCQVGRQLIYKLEVYRNHVHSLSFKWVHLEISHSIVRKF